jgi:glucosamine-6-phosphate deaminase
VISDKKGFPMQKAAGMKGVYIAMKVVKVDHYEELSRYAAELIKAQVLVKPRCVLGLATGSTPLGTYSKLIEAYQKQEVDFSKVVSVNLDEYYGLDGENDQSYRYFMNHNLFDHINIDKKHTYVPNGKAENIEQECERYDALIESVGGIDLQLLGIGHNGHIGFNEPCDRFVPETHYVNLGQSTIQANARFFASIDDVPKQAITMGIRSILSARKILLLAGADKREIVEQAAYGPVTPNVPASVLQLHPDVTIVVAEK